MKILLLILTSAALATTAVAQGKIEITDPHGGADNMREVLGKQVGQRVELRLSSGDKIAGKVEKVGTTAVHLSAITGQELFDAAVKIGDVSAVLVRTK